ncbi:MAG: methyltransferase domain-containing protein [Rhodospirillaceae bacterium]
MIVFDRALVRRRRDRAAAGFADHSFLVADVADRLCDRLLMIRRDFPRTLDLGCHHGATGRKAGQVKRIESLVSCDLSPAMAARCDGLSLVADEEWLPFADGCFDLVISNLSLHWVNDLPGALIQIRRVLRPDGFFLAAIMGGDTLSELRRSLVDAELTVSAGASPRVSPFADLRDAGGLLQRAGFALPVADIETVTVTYPDMFRLMADLRGMGETNSVLARSRRPARRALFLEAARGYAERYAESDGRITASFQILYLAGWSPHPGQQQPLRRGSATTRLADALEKLTDQTEPRHGPLV